MAEQEKWQWQEPGTTWKGVGLYHITLTVTDRQPVLGTLVVPDNNPTKAYVKRSALGDALVDCLLSIQFHHPEVQVLHFCLMPDHLHAVLYGNTLSLPLSHTLTHSLSNQWLPNLKSCPDLALFPFSAQASGTTCPLLPILQLCSMPFHPPNMLSFLQLRVSSA